MKAIGRDAVRSRLWALSQGMMTSEQLEAWFAALLVGSDVEVCDADAQVVFKIVHLFEDPPLGSSNLLDLAADVISVLDLPHSPDIQIDLLDIVAAGEPLRVVARKRGVEQVTETAWYNALANISWMRGSLKASLWRMPAQSVKKLSEALDANDYAAVGTLLSDLTA